MNRLVVSLCVVSVTLCLAPRGALAQRRALRPPSRASVVASAGTHAPAAAQSSARQERRTGTPSGNQDVAAPAPRASDSTGVIRPSTHPAWLTGGLGFGVGTGGGGEFRLSQSLGYHFSGTGAGPGLSLELGEGISGAFRFAFGGRFGWDIQPSAAHGIYVQPNVTVGMSLVGAQQVLAVFETSVGVDGRFVLNDRVMLFVRPLSLGLTVADFGAGIAAGFRYEFLLGAGVTL